jgi:hypothetical protein
LREIVGEEALAEERWLLPDGDGRPSVALIASSAAPPGPHPVAAGTLKTSSVRLEPVIDSTATFGNRVGSGSDAKPSVPTGLNSGLSTIGSLFEPM